MNKYFRENQVRAWSLLTYAEGGQQKYGGNDGYFDKVSQTYDYHKKVINYDQLHQGDIVLIRNNDQLFGISKINKISIHQDIRQQKRCPKCNRTKIDPRKKTKYIYRCFKCKYEFNEPIITSLQGELFTAYYGDYFIPTKDAVNIEDLKKASLDNMRQLSIRPIDFQKIEATLLKNVPGVAILLNKNVSSNHLKSYECEDIKNNDNSNISEYIPIEDDERQILYRQIKERQGQPEFRKALISRYGSQCMISGYKLLEVVEAAHISSYRGLKDNHPENGLLLRTDLHTLFDLDLLGIEPEFLQVKLHQKVLDTGYKCLEGRKLICSKFKPSKEALKSRWSLFLKRLQSDD
ncbi:hypothetical protein NIES4074_56120 [Cylindrospermum sp. NIES-4074]|nr:hypothetical protein NIES4074_56120 [Cylindrospermum sp. NIES-4074]